MPTPPPVVALPQVLVQAVDVARLRPMGVVGGDRIGYLLQGSEAVGIAVHEVTNPVHARRFEPDHHVDQDERGQGVRPLTGEDQRVQPAQ